MSARETATARRMRLAAGVYMAIRKQRTTMQARARQQLEQHMLDDSYYYRGGVLSNTD